MLSFDPLKTFVNKYFHILVEKRAFSLSVGPSARFSLFPWKCWQYWKLGKHSVYPENGTETENFDSKSQKGVSSWNVTENIFHLKDSTPWKLTKKNF